MSKQKHQSRDEAQQFRDDLLTREPDEQEVKKIKEITAMNALLKKRNPNVALPYRLIASLAEAAAEHMRMEYMARAEDAAQQCITEEEKLSFMTDEELAKLEASVEIIVHVMLEVSEQVKKTDEKKRAGGNASKLQA